MRVSALCVLSVVCTAAFAGPRVAVAQSNKVAAEALFEEGRRLMREGKTSEACPKFAESQRLDPAVGTLLNLANCYETAGRTASAWATYKEAASAASAAGRAENQKTAEKRAAALAPKLARLTIVAPALDGLAIKRDGADVQKAEVGVAIPVDPGSHTVSASAPQKKAWSTTINVDKEGAALTVTIPALEDAPVEPPPPAASTAPPPPVAPPPAAPPPERPAGDGGSSQRTIGLVVGGVGVVGLGVGTIFALAAKSKYNDSLDHCPRDKNLCTPEGVSQRDDARSKGNIATVGFGLGAAALVTGSVLFFTAPGGKESSALQIAPTLGGATMRGAFLCARSFIEQPPAVFGGFGGPGGLPSPSRRCSRPRAATPSSASTPRPRTPRCPELPEALARRAPAARRVPPGPPARRGGRRVTSTARRSRRAARAICRSTRRRASASRCADSSSSGCPTTRPRTRSTAVRTARCSPRPIRRTTAAPPDPAEAACAARIRATPSARSTRRSASPSSLRRT